MGIKLGGTGDFDETLFRITQAKAAENTSLKAETEKQFINSFEENNGITLSGSNGNYTYTYNTPIESEQDLPEIVTKSDFSNMKFATDSSWKIKSQEAAEKVDEDDDYIYYKQTDSYERIIQYIHTEDTIVVIDGNIWTNNARVIYHRKACGISYTEPVDDGYEGSENIKITLRQSVTKKWAVEKVDEIIVPATTFGAFPSGISADYCILVAKQDANFVADYENNASKLDDLNDIINDYEEKTNPYYNERSKYVQKDEKGLYICLVKEDIDNIVGKDTVIGVDSENNIELVKDWNWLYEDWDRTSDTIPSKSAKLENSLTEGLLQGYEEAGPVKCYKVYLKGMCQLIKFDVSTLQKDTNPGVDEIKSLDFPNGYYMIVGKELYLFLLTDINSSYWNGRYQEKTNDAEVTLSDHSSLIKDNNAEINLSSRVNTITSDDSGYYLYRGYRTPNLSTVSLSDLMLVKIANLRKVVISETVTVIGHLGDIANPDDGFEFPKNIEYIEPLTITYSANTTAYIPSNNLIAIADNAFYNEVSGSFNLTLYLCEDPYEAKSKSELNRGYISLPSSLKRIGKEAFKEIKPNVINLTNCSGLEYVGDEAFAVGNECKEFFFLYSLLSQRDGTTQNPRKSDLIYLPDSVLKFEENRDNIKINELTGDGGLYNQITPTYSLEYDPDRNSPDSPHATLGANIGGYYIHIRAAGLTLENIIDQLSSNN